MLDLTKNTSEELTRMLAEDDGLVRLQARKALVKRGDSVAPLLVSLERPREQLRWEAAKALGSLDESLSVPALVSALSDPNPDVAWLVGEALKRRKKAAWEPLLRLLMEDRTDSVLLCQRAHHVFKGQKEEGLNDLLAGLVSALESSNAREAASVAAYALLERMQAL
jgi:HEAT repeat protein